MSAARAVAVTAAAGIPSGAGGENPRYFTGVSTTRMKSITAWPGLETGLIRRVWAPPPRWTTPTLSVRVVSQLPELATVPVSRLPPADRTYWLPALSSRQA